MEIKTVGAYNKLNLLFLIVTLWVNYVHAASLNKTNLGNSRNTESSTKPEKSNLGKVLSTTTVTVSPQSSNVGSTYFKTDATLKPTPPSVATAPRGKRDTNDKMNENALASIRNLFPSNVDDEGFQKWLALLTANKPKYMDEYDDDEFYDDPPAIDLVHGKKPGSTRSFTGMDKDGAWVGDEPTAAPIVLHQHRMSKKASSTRTPELILREAMAASSRAQPEPLHMRNLLFRMIYGRAPRSSRIASYENNNGRVFNVGQLLEHSSRINEGVPAVSRMVL